MIQNMKTVLVAILVLLSVGSLSAQTFGPSEPLRLWVDYSRYRGNDDSTIFVEVYYSFPERSLTYIKDSAGYRGSLDLTIMFRKRDSVAAADRWLELRRLG